VIGEGETIGVGGLANLRPTAFVPGWDISAKPIQEAVSTQRLESPNDRIPRPSDHAHDGLEGGIEPTGSELDQIDEQLEDLDGDMSERAVAPTNAAAFTVEAACRAQHELHFPPVGSPPEPALAVASRVA
jgi:hypothetical protein